METTDTFGMRFDDGVRVVLKAKSLEQAKAVALFHHSGTIIAVERLGAAFLELEAASTTFLHEASAALCKVRNEEHVRNFPNCDCDFCHELREDFESARNLQLSSGDDG